MTFSRLVSARRRAGAVLAALTLGSGLAAAVSSPAAMENSVAGTPPMGWNSWNTFGCDINESLIRGMADALVSTGMAAAGYTYVVVDDCWFDPDRDVAGNLRGDPTRFPSGMKALGDYLHGKGLKFGLYEVPAGRTCGQYAGSYPGSTGSLGHEAQDARQFAAWGVDYLKYDWCSPKGTIDDQVTGFAKMRDALAATGRPILYSINPNSIHTATGPLRNWGDVANMWRTTEDITNEWDTGHSNGYPMGVRNIVDVTTSLSAYAAPGRFNDPDMMEVGRSGLTSTETRSHFALWAMMASPLIAGNDLRSASSATLALLRNPGLIAIDQDALGRQGVQILGDGTRRVLAKRLSGGDVAVALFNEGNVATTITTTAAAAGKPGSAFTLRDVWSNTAVTTTGKISATVPAHGVAVYRLSGGSPPAGTSLVNAASSRCLDAGGARPAVSDCAGPAGQLWTVGDATIRVLGKCLEAPAGATAGSATRLRDCTGGADQRWTLGTDGTIRGTQSRLCLDAGLNGPAVILWTCGNAAGQRWSRL